MRGQLAKVTVAIGLGLSLASAAHAQLKDNIEVNVFGSGVWSNSNKFEVGPPQSSTPINGKFRLDRSWRAGVRLGVYTRGHWGQEFYYSYEPNVAHIIRQTAPTTSVDLTTHVHNYGVNALYYLNENESHNVRTFVSVGVGGTLYQLTNEAVLMASDPLRGNIPDVNNSNEVSFNYGVGVKTRSTKWVGARVDVRGFISENPRFGLAKSSPDPNATVFPVGGALHTLEVSGGLIFYFFGKR